MNINDMQYKPGAHIFGVSLEQDLRFAAGIWGAKKRREAIHMILESYRLTTGNDLQPSAAQSEDKGSLRRKGQLTQKPPQPPQGGLERSKEAQDV